MAICFLLLAGSVAAQSKSEKNPTDEFHPTRLLAKRASGLGPQSTASLWQTHGVTVRKQFAAVPDLLVLETSPSANTVTPKGGKDPQALLAKMKALRASGLFQYVEPDYRVNANTVPSDIALADGTLWGLQNIGQSGGVSGADIGVMNAWDVTTGSSNVIVAVIDTGIRYTHQDLASQMWRNPGEIPGNGIDDDGDGFVDNVYGMNAITGSGDPFDDHDHGTHVAGTIGAAANSGGPHVGVAWQVRLMACKFLDASGSGYISDAVECVNFAVAKGAKILNNSWGGGGYSQAMYDAIAAARNAGVLFVAAAGNDGDDADLYPHYPAAYDAENVISVAALDRFDNLASFSTFGRNSVDLGAPGVDIYSSTAGSDSEYQYFNGTSMATPHVCGVAALIAARFPEINLTEMRQRLLNTTVPVPALAGRCVSGGRVNAYNALTATSDGTLEVAVSASEVRLPAGNTVSLFVAVSDLTAVTDATVTGGIVGGSTLTFLNNGTSPDQVAGDNSYTATLPVPMSSNSLAVRLVISAPGKIATTNVATFPIRVPPANDYFTDHIALYGSPIVANGVNVDASAEPAEPLHAGIPGGKSVWWTWTAPANGPATITTSGSSFDTLLGVYTGSSMTGLTFIAGNDDNGESLASTVNFSAIAGTTYQIAVDGYYGASGAIRLSVLSSAPLRMLSPQRLAGGTCRIWIASADGAAINPTRIPSIAVYASTNAAQPLSGWTRLTGSLTAANGLLRIDDPDARNFSTRFYRAMQSPADSIFISATSGVVTAPFVITNDYIYQPLETSLGNSGRATYNFTIATAGTYVVQTSVNAAHDGANSFFINIDAEPQNPYMISDIPVTSGFELRTLSWRGNGTFDANQFVPKVFNLAPGAHQLIIRGRESSTRLQSISIAPRS